MSKVACVILNYNDADNTIELVHQIEDYSSIDHIIVVDNVSSDDSMQKFEKLSNKKVTIHSSLKNGGYGYGNNFGIRLAKEIFGCKYAFVATPDVRFDENTVTNVLSGFKEDTKIKAITSVQHLPNDDPYLSTAWFLPTKAQYIFSALFFLRNIFSLKMVDFIAAGQTSIKAECIAGSFLCVECEAFLSIGGFDENIFLYCEETTLGFRYKAAGYEMRVVTDSYYYHYHETGSTVKNIKSNINRSKMLLKSRRYVLQTYLKASKLVLLIADICYGIAIIEEYLKNGVKEIIGRNNDFKL